MEYRALPHGGEKISVIGLGSAGLHNASEAEVERTIDEAPDAYKPIEDIIGPIADAVDIIDVMRPIYNFKAS